MMAILRAPELSATSRIERIWIMAASPYTSAACRTTFLRVHRLRRLIGRVSTIATVSPGFASFFSSCAMNVDVRRSVLPYSPWRTCHSTATTMLFCILLLMTTPVFSVLSAIAGSLLPQHCFDPREIAAHGSHLVGRFELAHRLLDSHPEQLIDEIAFLGAQFVRVQVAQFSRLH